jgi:copper chaperone CopZ
MNKKLSLVALCISFVLFSFSQITQATLQASGLTCAMCARSVYKNLEGLPFVDKIDTDLNASSFLIFFKPEVPIELDALSRKVQEAGFSVAAINLNIKINEIKVENDAHINIEKNVFHFVNVKSQKLNGNINLKLIDPTFVSIKESKKYMGMTKLACIKTGKAESCCLSSGIKSDTRIFHVTI